MNNNPPNLLGNAIENIFAKHAGVVNKEISLRQKARVVPKRELELALTVLLVELASADQNFDMEEYNLIATGLKRMFGTSREDVKALVNQANLVLANLRGTSKFGNILKENLTESDRHAIMEVINDVIMADGKEDGFEIYLRNKMAQFLGITIDTKTSEQAAESSKESE